MIFFSADWHLNHANIIKYCGRTMFMNEQELVLYNKLKNASQEEQKQLKISKESLIKMNETTINNCNKKVKENDLLFYLGDFVFKSGSGRGEGEPEKAEFFRSKLRCKNIIFLEGNHDTKGKNSLKTPIQSIVIKFGGKKIFMTHNPDFYNINYEINLVGHCHSLWKIKRYKKGEKFTDCINVGVDVWNFYPVSWEEIWQRYSEWLKQGCKE